MFFIQDFADVILTQCTDAVNVPKIQYNALGLSRLYEVEKDANVDIVAIVKETMPVTEIVTKATQKVVRIFSYNMITLVAQKKRISCS